MKDKKDKLDKLEQAFDEVLNNTDNLLQDIRDKHPELKEQFDRIDKMFEEVISGSCRPKTDKTDETDKKIYCECLGDIQYEQALTRRFPFKPAHEDQLKKIEAYGESSTEGAKISIDRNKGYCHTKLYNMCWQTNGEPIIIEKAMQRTGPFLVGAIHYADHPEWFPTPEDLNEFTESEVNV